MKYLLTLMFLIISNLLIAQTIIGLEAISDISDNRGIGKARFSGSGGIFIQEKLNKNIFLRQEALLALDGYSERIQFTDTTNLYLLGNKHVQYQINSLEIPVIALYKIGNKVRPYIGLGSSVKFAIISRRQILTNHEEYYEPINSTGFDFSLISLMGVETNIFGSPAFLEARYNYGLISIVNDQKFSSLYFVFGFKL